MSKLIEFYLGKRPDHKERYFKDILDLSSFWLEHDHKYIKWLFPIDSSSKFNAHAPVLTVEDSKIFSVNEMCKDNQKLALNMMIEFFGMQWEAGEIIPSTRLSIKEHNWLKHGGHNHLRISRIIRSLALCGQTELSHKFQEAMINTAFSFRQVNKTTINYWRSTNII